MRYIWLTFLSLAVLIGIVSWLQRPARLAPARLAAASATPAALVSAPAAAPAALPPAPNRTPAAGAATRGAAPSAANPVADSLVQFALRQLGTPYHWAGTTPETGFDCSGFLMYAYAHVGVPVPHSTALLIDAGRPVPRAEARPGDLVVFTGTAATSTTPGHAGIVISALGEVPLRFVHSSSARRESGVKISQVEGSDYERRFMQVRRVLSGEQLSATELSRLARTAPARRRIVAVVSPQDARPPAVKVADETEPPRPAKPSSSARQAGATSRPATRPGPAAERPALKTVYKPAARRRAAPTKASAKRPGQPKPAAKAARKPRGKAKAPAPAGRSKP